MKFNLEVRDCEGDEKFDAVMRQLNERFRKVKENNPKGYLDQFDQQFHVIAFDIAQELGGELEIKGDSLVFDFAKFGCGGG